MSAVTPYILNPARVLAQVGFADWLARGIGFVRAIGPYAAIEIILPGGTLFALGLWLYRRYQRGESLPPVIARSICRMRKGVQLLTLRARRYEPPCGCVPASSLSIS
jgi:hypothetical protein